MTFKYSPKCKGKSRQTGLPCGLPPIPFGQYCRFHGGNRKEHREKARRAMVEYERWSTDPDYIKHERIRHWRESQERYQMRLARKAGPEYVAGLLRERAAWKAARQREIAENKAARAARHQAEVAAHRQRSTPAPSAGGAIPYDTDPGSWDL